MRWHFALYTALAAVVTLSFPAHAEPPMLWDVATRSEATLAEVAEGFPEGGLVLVGELHDSFAHHLAQLEVIKAARAAGKDVAVGLEMIQAQDQKSLDKWVAGELSEREMITVFGRGWGSNAWPMYRPIFLYCRDQGLPMLGLNVPRSITRKVARFGFNSLTDKERGQLPPVACVLDPDYAAQLKALLGPHGKSGEMFNNFCEAQLVWDTAMAFHSLEHLKANPDDTVVIITGLVHAWKKAIPAQVKRIAEDGKTFPTVTLLPEISGRMEPSGARVTDTDYLMLGLE